MAVRRQSSADQATLERMAADTGRATRSSGSKNLRHALGGTAEMATKAAEYKPTSRLFGEGGSGRLHSPFRRWSSWTRTRSAPRAPVGDNLSMLSAAPSSAKPAPVSSEIRVPSAG